MNETSSLLGSPEQTYQSAYGLAFPQVLLYSSAILGILTVVFIAKSLWGKS